MIKTRLVAEIGPTNSAVSLEMSLIKTNIVLLTANFSSSETTEVIVSWSDLWNCLFLQRGTSMKFKHSDIRHIYHPSVHDRNKDLFLYFKPTGNCDLITVKWKDFREALLAIGKKG